MSNKTSGFKRAIGIVLGVITMLVLIALFVVLVMAPIPNIWVDKVAASDNAIDQTVSPTQSETYCPAPIGLADTGTYGDSAFQATVGNLSTQARYAAFGSVYSATVSAIGQKSSSDDVTLKDADSTDDSSVKTGAQKINQGARLINTPGIRRAETVKPVKPALGLAPRPVAPSSRISPPEPVEAPGNGEIAVG